MDRYIIIDIHKHTRSRSSYLIFHKRNRFLYQLNNVLFSYSFQTVLYIIVNNGPPFYEIEIYDTFSNLVPFFSNKQLKLEQESFRDHFF